MHHAIRRRHRLRLTVQLIAKALDIIQAVRHDNGVARQGALDGGGEGGAGILFGARGAVDVGARQTQGVVGDVEELEALDAGRGGIWGGGGGMGGDFGGEVLEELGAAVGFAAGGVAC